MSCLLVIPYLIAIAKNLYAEGQASLWDEIHPVGTLGLRAKAAEMIALSKTILQFLLNIAPL